jgi:uncharacterized membrane protein YfcA
MKFILALLMMAAFSFVACIYFPWWTITIAVAFISIVLHQDAKKSFFAGFFALFFLWAGLNYWISMNNEHLLAQQLSVLIIKMKQPLALVFMTGFVGGLVGGLSAVVGYYARNAMD